MKRIITAAVVGFGLSGSLFAESAFMQLQLSASVKGAAEVPEMVNAGEAAVTRGNPSSAVPVSWVTINGGKFIMGNLTNNFGISFNELKPAHEVSIRTFAMAKTAVTVEQYAECVANGKCTEPGTGTLCNWGKADRQFHPVNCVTWNQANQYARFKGARLPTEAEWEYAAASGGRAQSYPWGNEEPSCDNAVMFGRGGPGCGKNSTMPVCSKPDGNTLQGLCDMSGNVGQWVQDNYHDSYNGAPNDGSEFAGGGPGRVVRGGSFKAYSSILMSVVARLSNAPATVNPEVGFRIVR